MTLETEADLEPIRGGDDFDALRRELSRPARLGAPEPRPNAPAACPASS